MTFPHCHSFANPSTISIHRNFPFVRSFLCLLDRSLSWNTPRPMFTHRILLFKFILILVAKRYRQVAHKFWRFIDFRSTKCKTSKHGLKRSKDPFDNTVESFSSTPHKNTFKFHYSSSLFNLAWFIFPYFLSSSSSAAAAVPLHPRHNFTCIHNRIM